MHYTEQKPSLAEAQLQQNIRTLFYLWEFLSREGLQDDAREYLSDHENEDIPFDIMI